MRQLHDLGRHIGSLDFVIDTEIGTNDRRIVADLGGCAVRNLLAIVQHHNMVRNSHHHAHVMLNQQHGDAVVLADGEQQLVEFLGLARVKAGAGSSRHNKLGSVHMARAISRRRWAP